MKQVSERITTGGLVGQGIDNLLGRPRLGVLPLVIREAVQNSWDARRRTPGTKVGFSIRVRNLRPDEEQAFRRAFDQSGALESPETNRLHQELAKPGQIRVLELADRGTEGLSGDTRPDLPTKEESSRFINFFFDYGRAHSESGDGGTYGFGRSSLFMAGRAAMIVVDSLTETDAGPERRLMACRIGPAFQVEAQDAAHGRYSGRHFWGRDDEGIPQPLTGSAADDLAGRLGLPDRATAGDHGTTIMIPWPVEQFEDREKIEDAILHHLWPKLVPHEDRQPIAFSLEIDGQLHRVTDPAEREPYRYFVEALRRARSGTEGPFVEPILILRPRHQTGVLGVFEGTELAPGGQAVVDVDEDGAGEAPGSLLNHVALMRPSELVVRYLPVPRTERPGRAWAGVFICADEPFVRTAFALSEPPAHDDWIPDRLTDRNQKVIVNTTKNRRIPEAVRRLLGLDVLGGHDGTGPVPSLAGTSARFSKMFLSGDGQGASTTRPDREPAGGGKGGGARLSVPELLRLEMGASGPVAVFGVTVRRGEADSVMIRAQPEIHAEGEVGEMLDGLEPPAILQWHGADGDGPLGRVDMGDDREKRVELEIGFRGDYGVTLRCQLVEENAP